MRSIRLAAVAALVALALPALASAQCGGGRPGLVGGAGRVVAGLGRVALHPFAGRGVARERASFHAGPGGVAYAYSASSPAGSVRVRQFVPAPAAGAAPACARPDGACPVPASPAAPTASAPVPVAQAGDPYGFLGWLNATRAQYGLAPVGYAADLESVCYANNCQQLARGLGHHVMGHARRQNAGVGQSADQIGPQWMGSPGHRAALLDPTIAAIAVRNDGGAWTFSAR